MDIITEVDLQEKTDVAAKKLSGGQKRKLSVGIALIGDPTIIFMDNYFMHIKHVLITYFKTHSVQEWYFVTKIVLKYCEKKLF